MEKDRKRGSVGCEDDYFGDTSIQGLCGLVGTLLQLTIVGSLLDDIEDLLGESCRGKQLVGVHFLQNFRLTCICNWPSSRPVLFFCHFDWEVCGISLE